MRRLVVVGVAGLTLVVAAAGATTALAVTRDNSFERQAQALQASWHQYENEGLPASSVTQLQTELANSGAPSQWLSPWWVAHDGTQVISHLQQQTNQLWTTAVTHARQQAYTAGTTLTSYISSNKADLTPAEQQAATGWQSRLTATTPSQLDQIQAQLSSDLADDRATVTQVEAVQAHELALLGGYQGLIHSAQTALATATSDKLDPGQVQTLLTQLTTEIHANQDPTQTGDQLASAVSSLDATISLNNTVYGQIHNLVFQANQAQMEGVPNAASLSSGFAALNQAFTGAATQAQLQAVQTQATALAGQITTALQANTCGHAAYASGKTITVSLSLQEAVFYDNGCVVNATPVTTGRPALPTPTGTFHIFQKLSPITFVSTEPYGSPYWYPTTVAGYGMEFDAGGYYIHDWPYEASNAYGPGSEYDLNSASHGCIHIPPTLMGWLYSWTPMGTTVVVTN